MSNQTNIVLCVPEWKRKTSLIYFFYCPFASACWSKPGFHWSAHLDPGDKVLDLISQQQMPFLMDIFILAAWEIWKLRNAKIFDNGTPSIRLWLRNFKCLVKLQLVRVREDLHTPILEWLESIM